MVKDYFDFLSSCWPFSSLPPMVVNLLAAHMEEHPFKKDEQLITQGAEGDRLMVLRRGSVAVTATDHNGTRRYLNELSERSIIGEMALLTREPRTADVVATTPGSALHLMEGDFHLLVGRHPILGVVLTQLLAQRLGGDGIDVLGGKEFHGYRIKRRLGRGGMSVIYEAQELKDEKTVALKMMSHRLVYDPEALNRFQVETELVQRLDHPNILRVHDNFPAFYTYFMVMDYCDGENLAQILHRHGALPEDQVKRILGQLALALTSAHDHGIVHSDLKPANVMLDSAGMVKLMDFGIASSLQESPLARKGYIAGTPQYMAPEQFDCETPHIGFDIYGFGLLGFELITGSPVFEEKGIIPLIRDKAMWKVPPRDDIKLGLDEQLYEILCQCVAPTPKERQLAFEAFEALKEEWAAPVDMSIFDHGGQDPDMLRRGPEPNLPPTLYDSGPSRMSD